MPRLYFAIPVSVIRQNESKLGKADVYINVAFEQGNAGADKGTGKGISR
jgi:hypothetical protein